MKNITIKSVKSLGLKAVLLGVAVSVAGPSMAAPRDRDNRDDVRREKRDVQEARRDVKRERRDVQRADSPAERRREQREAEDAQRDLQRERQQLRRERNQSQNGRGVGRSNRTKVRSGNGYGNSNGYGNGNGNGSGSDYGYGNAGQRLSGVVTNVRSNQSFDVRISGTTFNVYTAGRLPRGLSVGDTVRVNGTRVGGNDIRNASVSISSNR